MIFVFSLGSEDAGGASPCLSHGSIAFSQGSSSGLLTVLILIQVLHFYR